MKIIFIFHVPGCSGMFQNVPACSGKFRNVPCSGFYLRPYGDAIYWWTETVHRYGRRKSTKTSGVHFFYKNSSFSLEG